MLRATAPIPSVTRRLPRGERASHSTFDSLETRSRPVGVVVPSPPGCLGRADPARGDPRHTRWPLLVLPGRATRGRPRKVEMEDLRQLTSDGHPSFDTRVRVLVVPRGFVTFAEPKPGVLQKREKSLRAPDHGHSVVERGWLPHVSRVELTSEPTTRFWTFRVDRAVMMCVALHERRTRLLERLAIRDHEQTMPSRRIDLARLETDASEERTIAAQSARLAQRGELQVAVGHRGVRVQ
jgi:hypothetical protein